ncbi:MAG: diphosphomevalonate/mevalonate 3,5-bisphosphate decarboxylase family protein [Promethearchaeota archaeon]
MDPSIQSQLANDNDEIKNYIEKLGYIIDPWPESLAAIHHEGEALVSAYPIQGLLKYHGMADVERRIAYFPSISLNNGVCFTQTYIKLFNSFESDQLIWNNNLIDSSSRAFTRVFSHIDVIRSMAGIHTKAHIYSRNVYPDFSDKNQNPSNRLVTEKGLGTSASAGAAIAKAMIEILYHGNPKYTTNTRLRSAFARYFAGSASRSAVGGIGLWLSHPNISPDESFSIRLDMPKMSSFIEEIELITIPIESPLQTESAHASAPKSPFFTEWAIRRKKQILNFTQALHDSNFTKLGELAEEDTLALHGISLTTGIEDYILAWEPITLQIMKKVRYWREKEKIPIYFSIDTGPTVVLLTKKEYASTLMTKLTNIFPNTKILRSFIAGPPHVISPDSQDFSTIVNALKQIGTQ